MGAFENLENRLQYNGGNAQQARMNESKLKSLKKALLYSYQAATAKLADGREFRCLINPDKLKNNYDDKIISIPFKDVCLNTPRTGKTTEGEVEIGMKAGDTFTWKENGSIWLVFLQRLEETAYFRAEVRRCAYEVTINGKKYNVYVKGPDQLSIEWRKGNYEMYNRENYTILIYITKDEDTLDYFKRFNKIEINNKPWEIQVVDSISVEGIIEVSLKETFTNSIEKEIEEQKEPEPPIVPENVYIDGPKVTYPYGEESYTIIGAENGTWEISNNKAKIISTNGNTINIEVISSRSGNFVIKYKRYGYEDIELPVTIDSL